MTHAPLDAGSTFLSNARDVLVKQKELAQRAIQQLSDEQLHQPLDENTNCVAVIMKHMAGNMLSRWSDFLASDGEKPWRDRDREFEDDRLDRSAIMERWEQGWAKLFETLAQLSPADLTRTVLIRGHPHSVVGAILRQIDHYGYHVGQIVLVARVLARQQWQTLTIPRGGSAEYNRKTWKRPDAKP